MSSAGKKDDLMSPYIKMMYRGGNNAKDIQPELDSWIEYNNNKYKEIDWDLKANEWVRINGMATRYIAEACRDVGAKLVYPSTDYVFGGDGHIPYEVHDEK